MQCIIILDCDVRRRIKATALYRLPFGDNLIFNPHVDRHQDVICRCDRTQNEAQEEGKWIHRLLYVLHFRTQLQNDPIISQPENCNISMKQLIKCYRYLYMMLMNCTLWKQIIVLFQHFVESVVLCMPNRDKFEASSKS